MNEFVSDFEVDKNHSDNSQGRNRISNATLIKTQFKL